MWLLLACHPTTPSSLPTSPGDTATTVATTYGSTPPTSTATTPDICGEEPDPERPTGWVDLLARLEAQRCLHEDDIALVEDVLVENYASSTLRCDAVWRVSSEDGTSFEDADPEMVLPHASVPDLHIDVEGHHWLVYNDVTPWKLVDVMSADPERLWRQGLLGWGGVGMSVDRQDGTGFTEVIDLDLKMERLQQAVDPDLGERLDGTLRMVWLGIHVDDMNPDRPDPLNSYKPHKFFRSTLTEEVTFTTPRVAVASSEGETGGLDPTVLDMADGRELMLVGPLDDTALGWWSDDGETWEPEAPPDLDTLVRAATPDARPDPEGGYRLHYMENGARGTFRVSRSDDGETWEIDGALMRRVEEGFNVTADVGPDGVWWMYFNITDEECVEG